jgi:hypothetical protein
VVDCFRGAKERCEALAEILNAAYLRHAVAASVLEVDNSPSGLGEPDER